MKELWEQAILPYNLPLSIALAFVIVFWLLTILGLFGLESADVDAPGGVDGDSVHLGDLPGVFLRFVNAGSVPLTVVLSFLVLAMWITSITANFHFNPGHSYLVAGGLFVGSFIVGVIFTKLITQPLVPLMKRLKEAENAKPVIGEIGTVRSIELTDRYGQVEIHRADGAPAILNARLGSDSPPVPRGTEIYVVSVDDTTGVYLVRPVPVPVPEPFI